MHDSLLRELQLTQFCAKGRIVKGVTPAVLLSLKRGHGKPEPGPNIQNDTCQLTHASVKKSMLLTKFRWTPVWLDRAAQKNQTKQHKKSEQLV